MSIYASVLNALFTTPHCVLKWVLHGDFLGIKTSFLANYKMLHSLGGQILTKARFSTTYFIFRSLLLSEFNYQSISVQSVICKIPTRFSRCFKTLQWSHACGNRLGSRYYSRYHVIVRHTKSNNKADKNGTNV